MILLLFWKVFANYCVYLDFPEACGNDAIPFENLNHDIDHVTNGTINILFTSKVPIENKTLDIALNPQFNDTLIIDSKIPSGFIHLNIKLSKPISLKAIGVSFSVMQNIVFNSISLINCDFHNITNLILNTVVFQSDFISLTGLYQVHAQMLNIIHSNVTRQTMATIYPLHNESNFNLDLPEDFSYVYIEQGFLQLANKPDNALLKIQLKNVKKIKFNGSNYSSDFFLNIICMHKRDEIAPKLFLDTQSNISVILFTPTNPFNIDCRNLKLYLTCLKHGMNQITADTLSVFYAGEGEGRCTANLKSLTCYNIFTESPNIDLNIHNFQKMMNIKKFGVMITMSRKEMSKVNIKSMVLLKDLSLIKIYVKYALEMQPTKEDINSFKSENEFLTMQTIWASMLPNNPIIIDVHPENSTKYRGFSSGQRCFMAKKTSNGLRFVWIPLSDLKIIYDTVDNPNAIILSQEELIKAIETPNDDIRLAVYNIRESIAVDMTNQRLAKAEFIGYSGSSISLSGKIIFGNYSFDSLQIISNNVTFGACNFSFNDCKIIGEIETDESVSLKCEIELMNSFRHPLNILHLQKALITQIFFKKRSITISDDNNTFEFVGNQISLTLSDRLSIGVEKDIVGDLAKLFVRVMASFEVVLLSNNGITPKFRGMFTYLNNPKDVTVITTDINKAPIFIQNQTLKIANATRPIEIGNANISDIIKYSFDESSTVQAFLVNRVNIENESDINVPFDVIARSVEMSAPTKIKLTAKNKLKIHKNVKKLSIKTEPECQVKVYYDSKNIPQITLGNISKIIYEMNDFLFDLDEYVNFFKKKHFLGTFNTIEECNSRNKVIKMSAEMPQFNEGSQQCVIARWCDEYYGAYRIFVGLKGMKPVPAQTPTESPLPSPTQKDLKKMKKSDIEMLKMMSMASVFVTIILVVVLILIIKYRSRRMFYTKPQIAYTIEEEEFGIEEDVAFAES